MNDFKAGAQSIHLIGGIIDADVSIFNLYYGTGGGGNDEKGAERKDETVIF